MAERPSWCPHSTCKPLVGYDGALCIGELPEPAAHGAAENTHRQCFHGAPDDCEWTFDLQINRGDAWNLWRLLRHVFKFADISSEQRGEGR